jgi:hypothetical protein
MDTVAIQYVISIVVGSFLTVGLMSSIEAFLDSKR